MLSSFNWVDYVILAIFLFSILAGFSRGLAKEMISLIILIAAIVVASVFSTSLAESWSGSAAVQGAVTDATSNINVSSQTVQKTVSYAAIGLSFALLFAATILIGAIIGFLVNLALSSGVLSFGNRLLGGVFGLGRGFLLNLVFIFVLQLTAVSNQPWWQQSVCVQLYQPAIIWLGSMVSPHLDKLKEKATEMMQNVGGQEQTSDQQE